MDPKPTAQNLHDQIEKADIPEDLKDKLREMSERLERMSQTKDYSSEFESLSRYLDWILNLPWNIKTADNLNLHNAQKILDKNHHGLSQVKERIVEYLAVLALKKEKQSEEKVSRAPILCLIGLAGTGKTTLGYSIAEAMGRKFVRIPFGGMGDSLALRGQSRSYTDAEPGQIIKTLRRVGSKNPVILLDEIDRVAESSRADIMGVLIELLDPEQNSAFTDHYIDYPFDLSDVLFVATANNTTHISTAVLDRLEPIQMPSYTDEEKITIAKSYILPKTLKQSGLDDNNISIDDSVWPRIVRPLGFDAGLRTLERTINGICRKIAKMILEGKGSSFHITEGNIKEFLPSW